MKIKQIKIDNFKRFNNLTIKGVEKSKLVLIVGANGCGKSSLLEAFYVWYKINSDFGLNHDKSYYLKRQHDHINFYDRIKIDFDKDINFDDKDFIKKSMYFRTAYRNEADFRIDTFSNTMPSYKKINFDKIIDNDASVSKNFQRLVSNTIAGVYSEGNNNKTVENLRGELIGKLQKSIKNIFSDLELNSLGNPFSDGAFYFKKGVVNSFHYKNLSAGEKSAFDLLLDLVVKIDDYNDAIFFIDEPEIHMHTSLQGKLVKEMYSLIRDNCQLWITTHSLGVLKAAKEIMKDNQESVAILDFSGHDFDKEVVIHPSRLDKILWEKFLSVALDDFSNFISPEIIVMCEGDLQGKTRKNFDATIYNKIFSSKYPNVIFISGGCKNDLLNNNHIGYMLLQNVLRSSKIYKLIDRDDMSESEVNDTDCIVLSRRNLECYMLDDEIIKKLCEKENKKDKCNSILDYKNKLLSNSMPSDDLKKISGELYLFIKQTLELKQCGSNKDAFMADTLCAFVDEDSLIYKELENDIFEKISKKG